MLLVTDYAKEVLKGILKNNVDNYYACLRLTSPTDGELGLGIDVELPNDELVEYEGAKLLVVEKELARRLDNVKLDAADTPEGPELVIEWAAQAA